MPRVEGSTDVSQPLIETEPKSQPAPAEAAPADEGVSEQRDSYEVKAKESLAPERADTQREAELKADLAQINREREGLKPELEKAAWEARLQLPKLLPCGDAHGLALVAEIALHIRNGDAAKAVKVVGLEHLKQATPLGEELITAYEISSALREYGALVKQDETLRRRAEEIAMKLDPSARFHEVSVGGRDYQRSADGLVTADGKRADWTTPHASSRSLSEDEKYVAALRKRHGL